MTPEERLLRAVLRDPDGIEHLRQALRRRQAGVIVKPTLGAIAEGMAKMRPERARRRWELLVGAAFSHQGRPDDFREMLDFNARLATRLREMGATERIWGSSGEVEDDE